MAPDQAVGDRVERPGPRQAHDVRHGRSASRTLRERAGDDALRAPDHLRCRPPAEGKEQDARGLDALQYEVRHAVRESVGFTCPRAGNDQERPRPEFTIVVPLSVSDGAQLGGIEAFRSGCGRHGCHYKGYLYGSPVPIELRGDERCGDAAPSSLVTSYCGDELRGD